MYAIKKIFQQSKAEVELIKKIGESGKAYIPVTALTMQFVTLKSEF